MQRIAMIALGVMLACAMVTSLAYAQGATIYPTSFDFSGEGIDETGIFCFHLNRVLVKDKIGSDERDKIKIQGTIDFAPGSEPFEAPPAVTASIIYPDPTETISITFPEESFVETEAPGNFVSRIELGETARAIMKVNFDECFWKVIIKGEDASYIYDTTEMPIIEIDFGGYIGTDTVGDWTKKKVRDGKRIAKYDADPQVNCLVEEGLGVYVEWAGITRQGFRIEGSAFATVTGQVYYCGLGTGDSSNCCPAAVFGNIAHIRRGGISLADKVAHAIASGAIGVIISNDVPGSFVGTLGGSSPVVVAGISLEDGEELILTEGVTANLTVMPDD